MDLFENPELTLAICQSQGAVSLRNLNHNRKDTEKGVDLSTFTIVINLSSS